MALDSRRGHSIMMQQRPETARVSPAVPKPRPRGPLQAAEATRQTCPSSAAREPGHRTSGTYRLPSKTAIGFEALVRPHLKPLYRVAYRMTGRHEDAEDLIQELLTKLYPRRKELLEVEHLRPWLIRVMYRLFIDQHRRQSRSPVHLAVDNSSDADAYDPLDNLPSQDGDPESLTEDAARTRLLLVAVERLSEDHRSVLSLHDIEGYTLEEMQIILECPIGTLKSRLHRARARLRDLLDEISSVRTDR